MASSLIADLVDCLIPGDVRPLAVDLFHRIFQALGAGDHVNGTGTLTAMTTKRYRMISGNILTNPYTVMHFGLNTATDSTVGTNCFDFLRAHIRFGLT